MVSFLRDEDAILKIRLAVPLKESLYEALSLGDIIGSTEKTEWLIPSLDDFIFKMRELERGIFQLTFLKALLATALRQK